MNLTSSQTIKELLHKHSARPSKGLGQNFLIDTHVLANVVKAAMVENTDTVIEIGPGIGVLTQELAKKAGKVIAIEKDHIMVEILKETLKDYNNVEIIQGNALSFKFPAQFLGEARQGRQVSSYKVVANIPYYITSPIIRKFLEAAKQPDCMVLMVQKEVAQRICAKPPHMSLLSVSVQHYANPKIVSYVPSASFWPAPKVDSAILRIENLQKGAGSAEKFFTVAKAGFLQPRKQLANNLSVGLKKPKGDISAWLLENNIKPAQRAQTLTLQDWTHLADSFLS